MSYQIDFRLSAEVNGKLFNMDGDGWGDAGTGDCRLDLETDPGFPEGFDPVSCPMMCSHPTSSFFSRASVAGESLTDFSGGAYDVVVAREGMIYDAKSEKLLHLEISSTVKVIDDTLRSYHVMRGFSRLPRLKRNIVTGDDFILPAGPGRAVGVVSWELMTVDDEVLHGICMIPYALDRADVTIPPLARTVEKLDVLWNGGNTVTASYQTSIRALSDVTAALSLAATS